MDAREYEQEVLRQMSPRRKLEVMTGLIRQAYALKAAGIRALHPHLAETEVQARTRAAVVGDGSISSGSSSVHSNHWASRT